VISLQIASHEGTEGSTSLAINNYTGQFFQAGSSWSAERMQLDGGAQCHKYETLLQADAWPGS
jgi:hypothetical protein